MSQKVLMFGWELPPFNSGGLGTACMGITKSMHKHGLKTTFVLPKKLNFEPEDVAHMNLLFADDQGFYYLLKKYIEKRVDTNPELQDSLGGIAQFKKLMGSGNSQVGLDSFGGGHKKINPENSPEDSQNSNSQNSNIEHGFEDDFSPSLSSTDGGIDSIDFDFIINMFFGKNPEVYNLVQALVSQSYQLNHKKCSKDVGGDNSILSPYSNPSAGSQNLILDGKILDGDNETGSGHNSGRDFRIFLDRIKDQVQTLEHSFGDKFAKLEDFDSDHQNPSSSLGNKEFNTDFLEIDKVFESIYAGFENWLKTLSSGEIMKYASKIKNEDFFGSSKIQKIQGERIQSTSPNLENKDSQITNQSKKDSTEEAPQKGSGDQVRQIFDDIPKEVVHKKPTQNIYDQVIEYAAYTHFLVENIAQNWTPDDLPEVIHCHDWLTVECGLIARKKMGIPLIFHIHATEYDRTGSRGNELIWEIEKRGMELADQIVAVSEYTKNSIVSNYQIDPQKIKIIHNGIDYQEEIALDSSSEIIDQVNELKKLGKKIILFIGRLTFQKGIENLVRAAKTVSKFSDKALFVICGNGDLENKLIDMAAEMGISDSVIFTGFLRGIELRSMYKASDIFVMPSVHEPFGLVALEAMIHQNVVIISKTSGVSEVIENCLKVDFWDDQEIANLILSIINNPVLEEELKATHYLVQNITWDKAVEKMTQLYTDITQNSNKSHL